MDSFEPYFSLVRTSKSSWVAVPVNRPNPATETSYDPKSEQALRNAAPASRRLLAQASGLRAVFSERYPRLTVAVIAILLFGAGVTVELEVLFRAGSLRH